MKQVSIFVKRHRAALAAFAVAAALFVLGGTGLGEEILSALNQTKSGTKACVVIDAGHGGFDPGKVGTVGTKEKDINLAIAKKVQKRLEESGYKVVMTREDDEALCTGQEKNKKMTDLQGRVDVIEKTAPAVAVSIHQNSYSAGTRGAQVFYYEAGAGAEETENKKLARTLQDTIRDIIGDENKRVEKGNNSYFMLKNISCPFAIVECGFLSNPQEEALLCDEKYQEKMAEGICEGIENFLYK